MRSLSFTSFDDPSRLPHRSNAHFSSLQLIFGFLDFAHAIPLLFQAAAVLMSFPSSLIPLTTTLLYDDGLLQWTALPVPVL